LEIDKDTTIFSNNGGGYALLLDWRPVPLRSTTINESYFSKDNSFLKFKINSAIRNNNKEDGWQRGYKVRQSK
jgi:hypothetical protein